MNLKKYILIVIPVIFIIACSSVQSLYIKDDYKNNLKKIKRVYLYTRANKNYSDIIPLVSKIAADVLELKKNYLVYKSISLIGSWDGKCKKINNKKPDGAILFSLEYIKEKDGLVDVRIKGELLRYGCNDKIWDAVASAELNSTNEDLLNLTAVYKEKYGKQSDKYAAPVFTLIQDLIKTMPDPILTDDEEMEKIELEITNHYYFQWFEMISFLF